MIGFIRQEQRHTRNQNASRIALIDIHLVEQIPIEFDGRGVCSEIGNHIVSGGQNTRLDLIQLQIRQSSGDLALNGWKSQQAAAGDNHHSPGQRRAGRNQAVMLNDKVQFSALRKIHPRVRNLYQLIREINFPSFRLRQAFDKRRSRLVTGTFDFQFQHVRAADQIRKPVSVKLAQIHKWPIWCDKINGSPLITMRRRDIIMKTKTVLCVRLAGHHRRVGAVKQIDRRTAGEKRWIRRNPAFRMVTRAAIRICAGLPANLFIQRNKINRIGIGPLRQRRNHGMRPWRRKHNGLRQIRRRLLRRCRSGLARRSRGSFRRQSRAAVHW